MWDYYTYPWRVGDKTLNKAPVKCFKNWGENTRRLLTGDMTNIWVNGGQYNIENCDQKWTNTQTETLNAFVYNEMERVIQNTDLGKKKLNKVISNCMLPKLKTNTYFGFHLKLKKINFDFVDTSNHFMNKNGEQSTIQCAVWLCVIRTHGGGGGV